MRTLTAMLKQANGGKKEKIPVKNPWFHQVLFGKIKERLRNRKRITSRSVRDLIKDKKLPSLQGSKVDGKEMCLV